MKEMKDVNEIAILRRHTAESKDLSIPVNYFFDLMDKKMLSPAKGHCMIQDIKKHSELMAAIKITECLISDFLNKKISLKTDMFCIYPQEKFYHGAARVLCSGARVFLMFFADIQIGITMITAMNGKTDYFRFTMVQLEVPGRNLH